MIRRAKTQSNTPIRRIIVGFVLTLTIVGGTHTPADDSVQVRSQTTQSTFFSDEEVSFKLNLAAEQAVEGNVAWQFSSLHRVLASGEVAIKIDLANPSSVTLRLRMPHMKAGVIQKTTLSASFTETGNADPPLKYEQHLWVFSPDPFALRQQWLEHLELQLFDPSGETARIFDEAKIPFFTLRSVARLRATESGIVIVAEGISLRKNAALAESLFSLAAAGRGVLWFIPSDGEFEFPGSEQVSGTTPTRLLLGGSDMIEQLDRRLDANVWNQKSIGLRIAARRSQSFVEIVETDTGWSWLQAEFGDPKGQLVLCGLPLVDRWDATPTPRFMLARLLEQLDKYQTNEVTDN